MQHSEDKDPRVVVLPDHPEVGLVLPQPRHHQVHGSALSILSPEHNRVRVIAGAVEIQLGLLDPNVLLQVLLDCPSSPPVMIAQSKLAI